ncbi:MAG: hypothetical protein ABIH92_03270 [Nanoarchaeota archaeon]
MGLIRDLLEIRGSQKNLFARRVITPESAHVESKLHMGSLGRVGYLVVDRPVRYGPDIEPRVDAIGRLTTMRDSMAPYNPLKYLVSLMLRAERRDRLP